MSIPSSRVDVATIAVFSPRVKRSQDPIPANRSGGHGIETGRAASRGKPRIMDLPPRAELESARLLWSAVALGFVVFALLVATFTLGLAAGVCVGPEPWPARRVRASQ